MISLFILLLSCACVFSQSLSVSSTTATANGILRWQAYYPQASMDSHELISTNIWVTSLASGDNTIYTCPNGYRMISASASLGTTNLTTANIYPTVLTNGSYYRLDVSRTVVTNNSGQIQFPRFFAVEPGEAVGVHCDVAGVHGLFVCTLIPTNIVVFTPRVYNLSSGDNTIYTCPSGFNAAPIDRPVVSNSGMFNLYNNSGSQRAYKVYLVPPASSPSPDNVLLENKTVSDNTLFSSNMSLTTVPSGYSVVVNSDSGTAGQQCWLNCLIELPQ